MLDMFGLSLDQQAKGERGSLNDTRTEFNDWDLGDRIRSLVTGQSREAVQKRAAELQAKDINKLSARERSLISDGASGTGLDVGNLKIGIGETEEDYQARLGTETGRVNSAQELRALRGGSTVTLDQTAGRGAIVTAASSLRDRNRTDDKKEIITETKRQERRDDDRYFNERKARREEQRFQSRRDDNRNDLTLQLAQMDSALADKRLAYDRETRSMDKRDKAIAALMAGLGSLGGAFVL